MPEQYPPLDQEESVEDLLASIKALVYPNAVNQPKQEDSSSKAEVQEVLSSFTKLVQDKPFPLFQKTVEGFLAEMIKSPLQGILKEGEPLIFSLVEKYVQDHFPTLLNQWMNAHLPALVKECVTCYLENLQQRG